MLIALLLQAAINAAPVQAPATKPLPSIDTLKRDLRGLADAEVMRLSECRARTIEATAPVQGRLQPGALYRRGDRPAGVQDPLWKQGELAGEGYYAAVERSVGGCPVPRPIHLPNAKR